MTKGLLIESGGLKCDGLSAVPPRGMPACSRRGSPPLGLCSLGLGMPAKDTGDLSPGAGGPVQP